MVGKQSHGRVSLEAIVESGELGLAVFHPGGLESTRELAELCHIHAGKLLLDVAAGTGESACYLAEIFGCKATGIDHSAYMVETAKQKAAERGLAVEFRKGDALALPFDGETFDAVISECTTCALDKPKAIREMARVTKQGGYVGISDLYWKERAPEPLKSKLVELEDERPETLVGWVRLFEQAGLQEVQTKDLSETFATMTRDVKQQLGILGQVRLLLRIVRRWGVWSLGRVMAAERVFHSEHLGYAIVVGRKP